MPDLVVRPTEITLFRYSAVTWNPHRIHYDRDYAAAEGYPNVLVQGHLHGAWLLTAVNQWLGDRGRVVRFSWQNRNFAVPGDVLTISGEVVEVDGRAITINLRETNQDGAVCAPGQAVVELAEALEEQP
jgi:hydroxyacyl-ACP dehydratase HTD2-like protein with hotdog domain